MNLFLKILIVVETVLIGVFILLFTGVLDDVYVLEKVTKKVTQVFSKEQVHNLDNQEGNDIGVDLTDEYDQGSLAETSDGLLEYGPNNPNATGATGRKRNLKKLKGLNEISNIIKSRSETALSRYFEQDSNLELSQYTSRNFRKSETAYYLKSSPATRVYVMVDFIEPVDYQILYQLKDLGITKIYQLTVDDYLNREQSFFYVPYYKLRKLAREDYVKDIYILKNYTGVGYYQLGIKSEESIEDISFSIFHPHSKQKKGHELLSIANSFSFAPKMFSEAEEVSYNTQRGWTEKPQNEKLFFTDLKKDRSIYFLSKIKSKISLNDMLEHNVRYAGQKVTLTDYRRMMLQEYPEVYEKYTRFTEKVVSSDYIKRIVREIELQNKEQLEAGLKERTVSDIWKQLTTILNKDIRYDWSKRKLFFSGNLPYYNIKDMYMTAKELAEKRVGACTERTSLEIAVLRELGVATRTSTRLYHIFTEIYLPEKGWVSTSSTLNEIPLTHSFDEKMGYFVSWSPDHPVKLLWSGFLLPKVVTQHSSRRLAVGKL